MLSVAEECRNETFDALDSCNALLAVFCLFRSCFSEVNVVLCATSICK